MANRVEGSRRHFKDWIPRGIGKIVFDLNVFDIEHAIACLISDFSSICKNRQNMRARSLCTCRVFDIFVYLYTGIFISTCETPRLRHQSSSSSFHLNGDAFWIVPSSKRSDEGRERKRIWLSEISLWEPQFRLRRGRFFLSFPDQFCKA